MLNSVVVSVVSFFVLQWLMIADASHFRHGTITWAPADSYSNRIRFIFRLAFRRSFSSYNCSQNAISSGILLGSGGSWRATCRNSLCSSTTVANTGFKCTDYSADEDWSMGENNFTYTFPSWDNEWVVSYQGCCWIGSLSRYPNGNWLVSTIVNLTRRTDSGRINSSPVSKSPAIVRFQEGCSQSLRIPVEDPDGDVVKCRRATYSESSRYTDSFPYGTLDENACLLSYDGKRGTSGTYAVALTLEDFPAGTTNFASISPFSAIGLQFLVIISGHYGSCADVPVFTASTPQDGQCSEVQIGSAYEAVIEVKLRDPSRHVVAIVTSSPIGMQTTYLRYQGGVFFKNVTWYPRQYQVGQQLFCFKAVDSIGLESEWRCVTILVGLSNTPRVIMGTRWPQSPKSEPGPGLNWWSIQFDRVIKKPRFSSYIRLVLLPSGYTVFKVDTLSQYVEITSNKTALLFALPKATLSMNGSYAIVIDQGAVVGLGCSYDGPPTPGISSLEDWAFDVDGVCSTGYYLAKPDYIRCVDVDECGAHSRKKRFVWWPNIISSSPTLTSAPATASVSLPSYQSECFNHTYLEDSVRGQGFYNGYYGYYQCDNNLPTGWYRFRGSAGTQMPTTCVGKNRCSSHAPGWLDASHPSVADGIINARVCFHWDYSCCHWYKNIRVRNCSGYYVYELGPTPTCWLRYCGNANYSNSSTPGISPTPVVTPAAAASQSPAVPGSCFYNLTDHQGNFTSPSHPYNYPHNLQCTWIISVTPGYYIHLYFHHFSLEYGASNCPFDYVDLFDQNFPTSSIKISRCGYQSAWCVYSSSNVLYVRFVTDGSVSNSGFLAHYERVHHEDPLDPGCIHLNDSYTSSIHATATHSSITTSIRVPVASASVSLPWYQSECLTHAFLEDSVRGQGFYNGYNGYYQCDRYLPFGWYRFRGAAGTQMPTTCVGKNRCSSHAPGWLNTSHPSVADGIVSGKVCFHWSSGCCTWSTNIRVRNCSGFYVYELGPPPACWLRYCGNGGGNYSTSSDTSISSTPAMTAGPADSSTILMSAPSPVPTSTTALSVTASTSPPSNQSVCSNHGILEDSVRGQGFYNGYYGYYQCDSGLPFGWYRFRGAAGTKMPTTCVGKNRCSSHAPGWLNTSHPSVADGIVSGKVCFHWSSGCCTWSTNIRVRNCSGFYVYELGPPPACWLRYCGNGGGNYSTSSDTSISSTPAMTAGPADSSTILMSAPSPVPTSTTALSVTASTSPPSNQSVCSNHGILEDSVRGQGFYNGYYGYYQCDSGLPFGWYRFRGAAGTKMPTTCVGKNRCSSHAPGWLNTSHPSVADGVVSGKVCFHWYSDCCYWSTNIRVRNCSGFYVYELRPPPTCWLRYCGNGGANYSTSSNTLLTPTPAMTSSATASRSFPVSGPCVYQFRGPNGNFSSPNHPYSYPHNVNCTWTITVTAGYRIYLQFSHFSLEYGGSHCPYDYVEIFDQNFPLGSIKINRCGYQSSWCVYSSSNVLYVRFVTDGSVSNSGFRAQYESVHYGNPLHPSCIHLNASSMTSIQATRTLSSAPMSTPSTKVSPTSSSNFYAYSSVAAISSPEFELHLPADCEQICSNTLGSYTCSCVSGYHLAADRKSCSDIDECSVNNGGCSHSCYNIPGSFYCGCPEGTTMAANNLTCVEPGVSVTCGENNMTVSLEKQLFPFFQVDQLHLRYSSYRATQNSTHLLISTPLNGCGTSVNETQDALIFWNAILSDAVIIDNVITRSHDIRMPFYCSYSRKKLLSLSFTPQWIYFGNEVGYGNFTFRMDFFKSDSFLSPYGEDDYPLELRLNEYMYVRYSVESSADLVIMAENCKATKSASMYSWPQYSIIENGCPRDTTMDYLYDPAQSHQQFKIKTFRFFNDYDIVYFHCELLACHRYSPNSRCSRGCTPRNKRKRRDVTRDDVEHEESTTKNVVTRGPLVVKEKVNTGDTGQSKNAALIGGMAGAGGFGLIAVIALAVLFVKYRIARRFMNRNKVGDLYTTQEQQMSRKNAYIQEDDMIEKDDSF